MTVPSVIVVEDDEDFRHSLLTYLTDHGIEARGAADVAGLNALWDHGPADILILDIGLPDDNGFAITTRFRAFSTVGIIMLTALNQEANRIMGLEGGADAYLVKPVSLREVLASVRRLHQRIAMVPPPSADAGETWAVDALNWTLISPDGKRIRLTGTEFRFISLFLAVPPGCVITYDEIFRAMGRGASEATVHSMESVIARLRRKMLKESGRALPLRASHGKGYSLQVRVRAKQ